MTQNRSELLDQAILRLVALPPGEQDRIVIEILADLCSEEEWVLLAASEPYQKWRAAQQTKIEPGISKPAAVLGQT